MESSRQMSESVRIGIFLTMAGGFMDAYSYICRSKVFANAIRVYSPLGPESG